MFSTKLNTKTGTMNCISDENLARLNRYEEFTFGASEDNDRESDEQVYHLGANHAFNDALAFVETQDVNDTTPVDGRLLTGVVIGIAVFVLYKPAKKRAAKLYKKLKR